MKTPRGDGNATKTALAEVTVLNLHTRLCTSSPCPQARVSPPWPWHCQGMVLELLQKGLASSWVCFPWLWWLARGHSRAQGQPEALVQVRRDASSSLQMLLRAKAFCRESRAHSPWDIRVHSPSGPNPEVQGPTCTGLSAVALPVFPLSLNSPVIQPGSCSGQKFRTWHKVSQRKLWWWWLWGRR